MRRSSKIITLLVALGLSACAGGDEAPTAPDPSHAPDPVEGALDTNVTLDLGEAAIFGGGLLRVEPVRLVQDSRCPQGAVCFWEGDAEVFFELEWGMRPLPDRVRLHTHSNFQREAEAGGYVVRLVDVLPHPRLYWPGDPPPTRVVIRVVVAD